MSVQRTGDMDDRLEHYGDLEVQNIRVGATTGQGGGAVANSASVEPLGPSELDNDEVAELVHVFRDLTVETILQDPDGDNGEENSLSAQYEMQVNASPSGGTNPQFITSDQHFGVNGLAEQSDEPVLDFARVLPQVAAIEEPGTGFTGGGGGGGGTSSQRDMGFRERFGMGPFLDNDDSLDFRLESTARGFAGALVSDVIVQAYWLTYTVEGARPTLSPPGR